MAEALQIDGKWYYAEWDEENQEAHILGYCKGWEETYGILESPHGREEIRNEYGHDFLRVYISARNEALPFKEHYHGEGHDTAEEARDCYRQFLLDQDYGVAYADHYLMPCKECGERTNEIVWVQGELLGYFCEKHQGPDSVRPHIKL
jgi:hypothetical protein